eukprot:5539468-Pleurochrysis_carterae.AAC.1
MIQQVRLHRVVRHDYSLALALCFCLRFPFSCVLFAFVRASPMAPHLASFFKACYPLLFSVANPLAPGSLSRAPHACARPCARCKRTRASLSSPREGGNAWRGVTWRTFATMVRLRRVRADGGDMSDKS